MGRPMNDVVFRWLVPFLIVALTLGTLASSVLATTPADGALGLREVRLEIKELKIQLTERIAALERVHTIFFSLLGITPFALVGLYLFGLRKASQLIEARLESIIESRPGVLLKLMDEHDVNQRLRRDTRIAIVSDNLQLEGVLRQHGFKKLTTITSVSLMATEVDKTDAEALTGARAVILDLVNGLNERLATEIMNQHGLDHVLAFSFKRVHLPKGEATFANSHMALFGRLEELLKYQDASEQI